MASWTFLTYHARVLLLIAHDPGARLRDIAASLNITERSAFGILTDLVEAGYVVKEKNGRRNRYHVQAHLPLPEPGGRERTVGEVLALLTGTDAPAAWQGASAPAFQAGGEGDGVNRSHEPLWCSICWRWTGRGAGAALMPVILWFEGDHRDVHVHAEIPLPAEGDSKQQAAAMMQEVAKR
jgi:hypothetical protein